MISGLFCLTPHIKTFEFAQSLGAQIETKTGKMKMVSQHFISN